MNYNTVNQSQLIPSTIKAIEQEVQVGSRMTLRDRNRLFQRLDEASKNVDTIQSQAQLLRDLPRAQILKNLEGLKEKITGLYGNIDDRFTDTQIHQIKKEAQILNKHIQQPLIKGNVERISKEVDLLKKHIHMLCENYRLHIEDRKVIAHAKSSMNQAQALLEGKPYTEVVLSELTDEMDQEEACLQALDLYEIAALFYQRKGKAAIIEFNQLPESMKKKFSVHLRRLDPLLAHPLSNAIKTVQALCAVANELSFCYEGHPYLSLQQIIELFEKEKG